MLCPYDGSQNMFLWKNTDNYPKIIPVTPSYLEHWYLFKSLYKLMLGILRGIFGLEIKKNLCQKYHQNYTFIVNFDKLL